MKLLFSISLFFASLVVDGEKTYIKNYYSNGILKEEGWILNNEKTNYWFFYFENGHKKEEGHYEHNLKKNWWIFYNDKQQIIKKSEFKNNKLNGLTLIYKQGEIIKAEKYTNGKKIKTWTSIEAFKKDNFFMD